MKLSIKEHVVSSPYANNLMVYDSLCNKYFLIKGNGKEIWELIHQAKSEKEICDFLANQYNHSIIEEEVMSFISSLKKNKLIACE